MGKVSGSTKEYQFFATKLAVTEPATLSCLKSCKLKGKDGKVTNPVVKDGHCFIANVCYEDRSSAEIFGEKLSLVLNCVCVSSDVLLFSSHALFPSLSSLSQPVHKRAAQLHKL